MSDADDVSSVTVTVISCETFASGKVAARATVDVVIDGVGIQINGVEVRRYAGGLAVELPHFRDGDGRWSPAVVLPPEVEKPLGRAVAEAAGFSFAED